MNTFICYIEKNTEKYDGDIIYFEIFYFTSSTEMEHELKLNSLCRLCGVKIPINSKSHPKENFKSAITSLYNIDIDSDSLNIHPSKICTPCRLRLTRYSQAEDATLINLPVLHEFLPHSDNCDICYVKPGRPKKVLNRKKVSHPSLLRTVLFVKNIPITARTKTVKTDQDLRHPPTVRHLQHHPLLQPIIHHVRQHAPFLSL